MKKQTLILFLFLSMLVFQVAAKVPVVRQLQHNLNAETLNILAKADKITIFKMASPKDKRVQTIAGYPIEQELGTADVATGQQLKALLLNDSHYEFILKKRCPFIPDFAFQFHYRDKHVNVLTSRSCDLVEFDAEAIRVRLDVDPAKSSWQVLSLSLIKPTTH